jgi:N6-adenosine-specific RNA methylase IME4
MTNPTRCAIYARISSDRDDTQLGVDRQEQDCRKLCADRGWTVSGVYADNDISAADPNVGPGKCPTLGHFGINRNQSSRWQRIAGIPDDEFEQYAIETMTAGRELTTHGVLQLARTVTAHNPVERPHLPVVHDGVGLPGLTGTFSTIVADPPWQYDNRGTRNAAAKHYPTLSIEDLCDLDVANHAADDAHLYLWTTTTFLRQAFDVMDAWGFTYKTNIVWVKPQMGLGNYFRVSHEHVLFGVRGSAPIPPANRVKSWFEANRGQHSAKPDSFLDIVETCSPSPGLEMFARRRRMTVFEWSYWGNEA